MAGAPGITENETVRDRKDESVSAAAPSADEPSLLDDVSALVDDAKVYAEAELTFQKSRAEFVGDRLKRAMALGIFAFGFLHLALIALAVGAVLSLATLVGPWIATIIVLAALLIMAGVLLFKLRNRIEEIGAAFKEPEQ